MYHDLIGRFWRGTMGMRDSGSKASPSALYRTATDPCPCDTRTLFRSWGDAQCAATGFNYRGDIPETLSFINDVFADLE